MLELVDSKFSYVCRKNKEGKGSPYNDFYINIRKKARVILGFPLNGGAIEFNIENLPVILYMVTDPDSFVKDLEEYSVPRSTNSVLLTKGYGTRDIGLGKGASGAYERFWLAGFGIKTNYIRIESIKSLPAEEFSHLILQLIKNNISSYKHVKTKDYILLNKIIKKDFSALVDEGRKELRNRLGLK